MAKKRIEKFDTARANSKEFTHFCGDCYDNKENLLLN